LSKNNLTTSRSFFWRSPYAFFRAPSLPHPFFHTAARQSQTVDFRRPAPSARTYSVCVSRRSFRPGRPSAWKAAPDHNRSSRLSSAGPEVTKKQSVSLDPGLRLVEKAEIATNLELAILHPEFGLIDLAVLRVQDGAAFVAIFAQREILDYDEADYGLVLVAFAICASPRFPCLSVGLGSDLAESLPPCSYS
jgi:hypothetical protein